MFSFYPYKQLSLKMLAAYRKTKLTVHSRKIKPPEDSDELSTVV